MLDAAAFQHSFGSLLTSDESSPADPALARAIAIHRNNSLRAAESALADNYPVTRQLVGGEAFEAAALAFAAAMPPRDPRLCLYGQGFPDFIKGWQPFAGVAWVGDVASLERAVVEALFAADAEALNAASFAQTLDLQMPVTIHPAVRVVPAQTPIVQIWNAHQPGTNVALETIGWVAQTALVTRPHLTLACVKVPPETAAFVAACRAGRTLGEAALGAGEALSGVFGALVTFGAFTKRSGECS